jgi:predicted RNase H-like HicB family nuclease
LTHPTVLGLPGCHSQGKTEADAVANIKEAIRDYLVVVEELARSGGKKQLAVEV